MLPCETVKQSKTKTTYCVYKKVDCRCTYPSIHRATHPFIYTFIHLSMHAFMHPCIHPSIHSLLYAAQEAPSPGIHTQLSNKQSLRASCISDQRGRCYKTGKGFWVGVWGRCTRMCRIQDQKKTFGRKQEKVCWERKLGAR